VGSVESWGPNCRRCRWDTRTTWFRTLLVGMLFAVATAGRFKKMGDQPLTIGIEEEFQIIDAGGELKAHIDTLLGRPRRLLILRRGRRAPGEAPRPAKSLTQLPGVGSLIDVGG
jgi:hypothetical protein